MKLQKKNILDGFFRAFSRLTPKQQIGAGFLFFLLFVLLFFPLIKYTPNGGDMAGRSLRVLSGPLFKTGFVSVLVTLLLLGRNMSVQCKDFVHTTFGFRDNDNLLNFLLLWILLSGFLGLGEAIGVSQFATATISTTFWYGLVTLLLFIALVYTLFLMLQEAKILQKSQFMSVMRRGKKKIKDDAKETVQSLFSDDDEEEEKDAD